MSDKRRAMSDERRAGGREVLGHTMGKHAIIQEEILKGVDRYEILHGIFVV